MKADNKTILIFILVFFGIVLCGSQGWAFQRSGIRPLQVADSERQFACTHQGPAMNKKVVVHVSYKESNGISVPEMVSAKDLTHPKNALKAYPVEQPYIFLKEKNPQDRKNPQTRASRSLNTGPPHGSIICTKNNFPVYIWGNHAWFIKEAKQDK